MKSNKLEIVIPTYNRSDILKANLQEIEQEIIKYNVKILISDDSENNEILEVVNNSQLKDYITFIKNEPSLGHDKNCISALSRSGSEYVWYLGDSIKLECGFISKIMDALNNNSIDLLVLRRSNKNLTQTNMILSENEKKDIIWHITLSGVSIYRSTEMKKYFANAVEQRNFPQAYISSQILQNSKDVYYLGRVTINPSPLKKKSYWKSNIIEVFGYDWVSLVNNLHYLSEREKKQVKLSHSKNTGIFGIKKLLEYRCSKNLFVRDIIKHKSIISEVSHLNIIAIILILMLPRFLVKKILMAKGVDV